MSSLSVREQILENCQMFFGQEVKIITLRRNHRGYYLPTGGIEGRISYTAIVLPKNCSLKSIAECDSNKILLESKSSHSYDVSLCALLAAIERKLGEIFQLPSSDEEFHRVDKSKIPAMFNTTTPDDTQKEPAESSVAMSCTQTREGEDKLEEDGKEVEESTLNPSSKRVGNLTAWKGRIWRVVGYTPSGEPCIEEHDPETPNTRNSFVPSPQSCIATNLAENHPPEYPGSNSKTDFTPGTSVASGSGTITPSLNNEHSQTGCVKRLEGANVEIVRLTKRLEEANWEIGTLEGDLEALKSTARELEQRLLGAESLCKEQEDQMGAYEAEKKQLEATTESMSSEIATLKESLRTIKETQAAERRQREEQLELEITELARRFRSGGM